MEQARPGAETVRLAHGPAPTFEGIALERGYVTPEQVEECRGVQKQLQAMGLTAALGEVLLKKGCLTSQQAGAINSALGHVVPDAIPGYVIVRKIAEGGMGAVYKAIQTSMDRVVALKVLLPNHADEASGRERFVREARAAARLSHPNIVAGIDAGESQGIGYFVMEFLDGEPVDAVLRSRGRLPWREAAHIVRQMALALDHAHAHGIVHRDVKPGNIILLKDGTAKLADLGLARFAASGDAAITQSGMIVGSPSYVSPEQATGERDLDIRSDIYSLGLTFFELVSGERAYAGQNPMTVISARLTRDVPVEKLASADAPKDAVAVIVKMTRREPGHRYATPKPLLEDLDALLALRQPAHAVGAPRASHRRLALAAGAMAAALIALIVVSWPGAGDAITTEQQKVRMAAEARLTLVEAIKKGVGEAGGGTVFHAELEPGYKSLVYSIDVAVGTESCNVLIDAATGRVVEKKMEADPRSLTAGRYAATLLDAVQTALQKEPGQPVEAEMLPEGPPVIEVKIVRGGAVHVVRIGGRTGAPE